MQRFPSQFSSLLLPLCFCCFFLLPVSGPVHAQLSSPAGAPSLSSGNAPLLDADDAFALNTLIEAPATVVVMWEIQRGYYLYQKSLALEDASGKALTPDPLPGAQTVTDEFFGEVKVYFDRLLLRLPLADFPRTDAATIEFDLAYQGCAADRFCYPPQQKHVVLTLPQ